MVDPCRCRYCGELSPKPLFFPLTLQRIVNYIWDNPGCTLAEIQRGVYGGCIVSNIVSVSISKIRVGLRGTNFRLISTPHPTPSSFGHFVRRIHLYRITFEPSVGDKKTNPKPTEGINNVTS